jgi:hypothetical protein
MDRETATPVAGTATISGIENYVARYRHKADVLKLIHSNKAESARRWDVRHTLAIIVLGALITFFGFMGPDRIMESLHPAPVPSAAPSTGGADVPNRSQSDLTNKRLLDLGFNVAVLLLFVTSLLNLIYRWKEKQTEHFAGVVKLTQFINWLDEVTLLGTHPIDFARVKQIRTRYQRIVDALPPNDEKDYKRAKASQLNKTRLWGKTDSSQLQSQSTSASSDEADFEFVCSLIKSSPVLMHVLEKLHETDNTLWLSGGAVRNHVWSCLTGRTVPVDDFDIAYFDRVGSTAERDDALEAQLSQKLPSTLRVSVKNQARMHLVTGEPERDSFSEAIKNYPETASCVAVRLVGTSQLELLAPVGLDDLLDMLVRPTPYHAVNRDSYEKRKVTKNWKAQWPEIRFAEELGPPPASDP